MTPQLRPLLRRNDRVAPLHLFLQILRCQSKAGPRPHLLLGLPAVDPRRIADPAQLRNRGRLEKKPKEKSLSMMVTMTRTLRLAPSSRMPSSLMAVSPASTMVPLPTTIRFSPLEVPASRALPPIPLRLRRGLCRHRHPSNPPKAAAGEARWIPHGAPLLHLPTGSSLLMRTRSMILTDIRPLCMGFLPPERHLCLLSLNSRSLAKNRMMCMTQRRPRSHRRRGRLRHPQRSAHLSLLSLRRFPLSHPCLHRGARVPPWMCLEASPCGDLWTSLVLLLTKAILPRTWTWQKARSGGHSPIRLRQSSKTARTSFSR